MPQKILVVDDNQGVLDALSLLFDLNDLQCETASSPEAATSRIQKGGIDLVIQDMNFSKDTTSGEEGAALFASLRELDPDLPIVLLTAWTHLEQAVDLVKGGAADYLAKPWDDEKLLVTVRNLLALRSERAANQTRARQNNEDREALAQQYDLKGLVYASSAMHQVVRSALKVARSDLPVLITGSNGVGKQKIAEIVQANSPAKGGPFVTVNAGALPESLIEAELFGAEAGSYTGANKTRQGRFELADGGTLFLDEISNLPLEGQAKLLRVLQTGELERLGSSKTLRVNTRVVSATNENLPQAVANGTFREDLFYRLNVVSLEIPPLADRRADILPLARHFLDQAHQLSPAAEAALTEHNWPGNVRELENCIRRACVMAEAQAIQPEDLGLEGAVSAPGTSREEQDIRQALAQHEGVVARAARELNLSRQAMYRRMEKYGIES